MKRKTSALLAGLALAFATVAIAQIDDLGPGRDHERQARFAERRLEVIEEYLDLSEAQAYEWESLAATQREARRAEWDSLRSDHQALRELLDSGTTDATRLGEMVLDLHARQLELRAQHESDLEALKQILTPEQAERFEALVAAHQMRPGGPGFRGRHPGRHRLDRGGLEGGTES